MSKRIAIYGRVSTTGQSTEIQLQECRQYAERCGYEVVATYTDTISGTTSKDDRVALTRLLEDAFTRKFDTVVVYSIDRLGRSLKHCLEILDTLKSHRCDFVSIKQQIDTDLPGQIWSRMNVRLDRNQGGHGHAQETVYARGHDPTSADG